MAQEIKVIITNCGVIVVDHPVGMSAIQMLPILNEAVRLTYKQAVREEAARVNQLPEQIQKLVDVIRAQQSPEEN